VHRASYSRRLALVGQDATSVSRELRAFAGGAATSLQGQVKGVSRRQEIRAIGCGATPALLASVQGLAAVDVRVADAFAAARAAISSTCGDAAAERDAAAVFCAAYALVTLLACYGFAPALTFGDGPAARAAAVATGAISLSDAARDHAREFRAPQGEATAEMCGARGVSRAIVIGDAPEVVAALSSVLPTATLTLTPEAPFAAILRCIGEQYVRGFDPDFRGLDAPFTRTRVRLPHYQFARQSFWAVPSTP
jgi:acyl transferase domain-containing protein